jgi:hypothetical protein
VKGKDLKEPIWGRTKEQMADMGDPDGRNPHGPDGEGREGKPCRESG